jgi:protein-S-isoprenylcysteine O-methyltransferase Ste14
MPWQTLILAALLLIELVYMVAKTWPRTSAQSRGGYLTTGLWGICFFASMTAALMNLDYFGAPIGDIRFVAAIAMIGAGIAIRIWGLHHLGHYFAELIVIREDHKLITGGPYRFLRHPLHAGLLLQILGFALIANLRWVYLLAIIAGVVAIPREFHEEQILKDNFGQEYDDYRRRTFGLTNFFHRPG